MKNLRASRVNVMVRDMEIAIDFYCNLLDLSLLNRYQDHYAEIQAADLLIGLHPADQEVIYGSNLSVGLGVINFDETVEALQNKGLSLHIVKDGWIRLAHFSDPDGNRLFLAERTVQSGL